MKIGILMPFTEYTVQPAAFARLAERLGFDSLWIPEHPVIPVEMKTPYPFGGPLPNVYSHMCDPFVALSMAAAVTTTLKLATGICLVPERNPLVTAKAVATLDNFSGGRVIFGVGAGWLREESELMGVDFPRRWTQTAEFIAAMRELWRKPEASFEGRYVRFPAVRAYPKPSQPGGPPVYLGAFNDKGIKRVAKWADGWCPINVSINDFRQRLTMLSEECKKLGRDASSIGVSPMGLLGDQREIVQEALSAYRELGAERFVIAVPPQRPEKFEAELERFASLYL